MLRTALASVAAQSAIDQVKQIVVVENGLDKRSKDICEEFPTLPIEYVYREVPIAPGYNSIVDAMRYISQDHLAILFDDDWWVENHLERGLNSLTSSNQIIASFSACAWIEAEDKYITGMFSQESIWMSATCAPIEDRWILGLVEMLTSSILSTCLHLSSLIVRRDAWETSLDIIKDGNPYDTDRLIAVRLGTLGKVAVDRIPSVLIRRHSTQECDRFNNDVGITWWNRSTGKLLELADQNGIDLKRRFEQILLDKKVSSDRLRSISHFGSYDYLVNAGRMPVLEVTDTRKNDIPSEQAGKSFHRHGLKARIALRIKRLLSILKHAKPT